MKKIRYPFDLQGQMSISFKDQISPIFVDISPNNSIDVNIDEFVVKGFNYDSESRLLTVSLQKAINAIKNEHHTEDLVLVSGSELENNIIKLDLIYCLYNAAIISSHIHYPLGETSFIKTISISKSLILQLN